MKRSLSGTVLILSISAIVIHSQVHTSEISGKVIREWDGDTDLPISNASIYLHRSLPTGGLVPYFVFEDSVKTDSKGNYSFDSIINDSYLLTFTARGYRTEQVFLTVKRDTVVSADLILLTKFYNLRGRVTVDCPMCDRAFPAPLPGCTVSVNFPQNYTILNKNTAAPFLIVLPWPYRAITGNDGTYLIDSIPADTLLSDSVLVRAIKIGYQSKNAYKKLHATRTDTLDFSLSGNQTGIWKPALKTVKNEQIMSYQTATSTLQLTMTQAQSISVNVYSPDGKLLVDVIRKKHFNAGQHSVVLQKEKLSSGIVLIRAVGDNFYDVIKVMVDYQ